MSRKTEGTVGWGLRVGGSLPYLAWEFFYNKQEIEENANNHTVAL